MTTLASLFRPPTDLLFHPRLRAWKQRLSKPDVMVALEVFREQVDIGIGSTDLILQFTENGVPQPAETWAWDDDINAGLVRLGVRSASPENEAVRFAIVLRAALRVAEREFGDGFVAAVVLEFIRASDLAQQPTIAALLPHAHSPTLSSEEKADQRFDTCRELIELAIVARAHELTNELRYPEEEAKRILVEAIAKFLDDRFSVSQRKRRGWI